MIEVIGVRFREEGKTYYFAPNGTAVTVGTDVIVETSRGIEYGVCVSPNEYIEDALVIQPLRPLIRPANDEDRRQWEENRKKETEAFAVCEKKIAEHGLDMKLVEVEYTLDGSKILFFFTSEGRVDFRELVKELASHFRTRIELRQIGVRDEARMLGGLGICGRPFCCATFMDEFQPVSIKMAKTQNLSLNPTKISGTCGRLMCCLKYEQETYEYLLSNSIRPESYVKTVDGKGTVVDVNLFTGVVKVKLEGESNAGTIKAYKSGQVFVLRNGKKGPMQEEPEDLKLEEPEDDFAFEMPVPEPAPTPEPPAEHIEAEGGQRRRPQNHNGKRHKKPAEQQSAQPQKEAPKADAAAKAPKAEAAPKGDKKPPHEHQRGKKNGQPRGDKPVQQEGKKAEGNRRPRPEQRPKDQKPPVKEAKPENRPADDRPQEQKPKNRHFNHRYRPHKPKGEGKQDKPQ